MKNSALRNSAEYIGLFAIACLAAVGIYSLFGVL